MFFPGRICSIGTHKLVGPRDLVPQMSIEIGKTVNGVVTYVKSPTNFAVQPVSYQTDLETINALCATLPEECPPMDAVIVGTIMGAICSEDGLWYRSLIQSVHVAQQLATVYFIDYGNTGTVAIEGGLRWLTEELTKFPPQVLQCQWIHASTSNTSEATARINALTNLQEITMTVVGILVYSGDPKERLDIGGEHGTVIVKIKELDQGSYFFGRTLPTVHEIGTTVEYICKCVNIGIYFDFLFVPAALISFS